MSLKNITSQLIERFITETKKKENVEKIQHNLIDPLIKYTIQRLQPYLITISVIFLLTFILALAIFYLIIKDSCLMKSG